MKQCLVMQHVAFEDLGTFAPVLEEKGFAIRYCPVDEPPTEEEWLAADLAVVLGGAIGVYDQVLYPFLKDEKDLIRKRLESQKPLLGICLGAQLIASAALLTETSAGLVVFDGAKCYNNYTSTQNACNNKCGGFLPWAS